MRFGTTASGPSSSGARAARAGRRRTLGELLPVSRRSSRVPCSVPRRRPELVGRLLGCVQVELLRPPTVPHDAVRGEAEVETVAAPVAGDGAGRDVDAVLAVPASMPPSSGPMSVLGDGSTGCPSGRAKRAEPSSAMTTAVGVVGERLGVDVHGRQVTITTGSLPELAGERVLHDRHEGVDAPGPDRIVGSLRLRIVDGRAFS